jgi:alkylated DNA repair dioxygenase AlkB
LEEEHKLIEIIDTQKWLPDLKRRVQHFGFKYDYRSRLIDKSYFLGVIPDWMNFIIVRMKEKEIIDFNPDQAIINEYIEDQGIAAHIDCEPCFGDTIISLSLSGTCVLNFQQQINSKEEKKTPLFLERRSLVVMKGKSRYEWFHGIPPRKSDNFNGTVHKRGRRISITFRKVILEG